MSTPEDDFDHAFFAGGPSARDVGDQGANHPAAANIDPSVLEGEPETTILPPQDYPPYAAYSAVAPPPASPPPAPDTLPEADSIGPTPLSAPRKSPWRGVAVAAAALCAVVLLGVALTMWLLGGSSGGSTTPFLPPSSEQAVPPPPDTTAPADPAFSWWGDGLSVVASTFHPIVGTPKHDYYWNADNSTTPEQSLADMVEAAQNGELGGVVVFAFGNSSEVTEKNLQDLARIIGDRPLVLVGVGSTNPSVVPWADAVNRRYAALAHTRPDTQYIDWQEQVDENPSLVRDGFILTKTGTAAWVNAINSAVLRAYGAGD